MSIHVNVGHLKVNSINIYEVQTVQIKEEEENSYCCLAGCNAI
jgi:hypothetical protein